MSCADEWRELFRELRFRAGIATLYGVLIGGFAVRTLIASAWLAGIFITDVPIPIFTYIGNDRLNISFAFSYLSF